MKKISYLVLTLSLLLTGCHTIPAEKIRPLDLRTMTFNIRNGRANDGENRWELRKEFVCDVIRDYAPDVLGVQEAFRFQLDEFRNHLPEYGEVGIGRDGDTKGEYSAILYKKKRFDVVDAGTFWLSDTPTTPSQHWGSACRRVCTWSRLIDKETNRPLYIFNTHLDHESQLARVKGLKLIMSRIQKRSHQDPFILMGDLNAGESNPAITYLKKTESVDNGTRPTLVDSFRVLHPTTKEVGTFSGFKGRTDGEKIDYILVEPTVQVLEASIVRTEQAGRNPSDHYPVTAQLKFE